MLILQGDIQFIHVPKTGGTYIRDVIKQLQIPHDGDAFNHDDDIINPETKSYFTCIRDLDSWMISYFLHRERNGFNWQTHRTLDRLCQSNNLNEFFSNLIKYENLVSDHYEYFLRSINWNKPLTILKTTSLSNDLFRFLETSGFDIDKTKYLKIENHHRSKKSEILNQDLILELKQKNQKFYQKYESYL